jgi:hypothetical protein
MRRQIHISARIEKQVDHSVVSGQSSECKRRATTVVAASCVDVSTGLEKEMGDREMALLGGCLQRCLAVPASGRFIGVGVLGEE